MNARRFLALIHLDYFGDMCIATTNILLLQHLGLSAAKIFGVVAAIWIVEAGLEVPTGIFADVVGRRVSVVTSFVIRCLGYSALFFSHNPVVAISGALTGAIGGTFASGAIEAWAVDELRLDVATGTMDRFFKHSKAAESSGLFLGLILGAIIGQVTSLAVPQIVAGTVCLCGALLAVWTPSSAEPRGRVAVPARLRTDYREAVSGLGVAIRKPAVAGILLLMFGLFVCRGAPGVQWTVHFSRITGGNLIVLAMARGLGDALQVPLLLRTAKLRSDSASRRSRSITLFAVLAGAALIAAALVPNGYAGLALFTIWGLAWGLCMPGLKASLNSYLTASSRATVLSFGNLLNSLGTGAVLVAIALSAVKLGDVGLTWTVSGLGAAGVGIAGAVLSLRAGQAATQSPEPIMVPNAV